MLRPYLNNGLHNITYQTSLPRSAPYTTFYNYADIFIDMPSDGSGLTIELTICNTWMVGRIQSYETYKLSITSQTCLFGLISSNYPNILNVYQIEFQSIVDKKCHFRIYNLRSDLSLNIHFNFQTLPITKPINIRIERKYDLSIQPKEPQLVVGEARYYEMNSNSTVFNKLVHIENCSNEVAETIVQTYQNEFSTSKSIKISKKYQYVKITSTFHAYGIYNASNLRYKSAIPDVMFIKTSNLGSGGLKIPIIQTAMVSGANGAVTSSKSHSYIDASNTYMAIESHLVFDGYDDYYYYAHIEYVNTNGYNDNMIEIIGVNSRKKIRLIPIMMYGLVV